MNAIIWLAIMIVLLVIEIGTMGLTTIWFAGGSFIACLSAWIGAPIWLQLLLFLIVSLVLLLFTRPFAVRYLNRSRVKTNVDSLFGKEAVVVQKINNLQTQGQVRLNGMEWTARTTDNQEIIEEGAVVIVQRVDGVKLIVKRKEG